MNFVFYHLKIMNLVHLLSLKENIMLKNLLFFLFLTTNSIFAQHTNVLIGTSNNPNEPSIFISPKNADTIIAASNIANYYYSYDGGFTWTENVLTSPYGVWGDPCIVADTAGHFYFFHLSNTPGATWIDRIVCQKTSDAGQTWNNGSFTGLNGTKQQDKHWVSIDKTNNNIYVTWTEFDSYGSTSTSDKTRILFSKSLDAGLTWSNPVKINDTDGNCIDSDETVEGATSAVGPNGEIYVSWAGPDGLVFNKSLDQGNTWLVNNIFIDAMPTGWDYEISGISRANGLPITKCDLSGGPNHGTIYLNWSDQRNGLDNTDIWFSKSDDGGNTWTLAKKVNQDNSDKQQFFTWMEIDQTTGFLYFVYYDRRNYTDDQTDVYLAYSTDGGNTFKEEKISESPFIPNPGIFFGDYTNISVQNGVVRPIWTRLNSGTLEIYTSIIDTSLLDLSIPIISDTTYYQDTTIVNDTMYILDVIIVNGDTIHQQNDTIYIDIVDDIPFKIDFQNFPNPVAQDVYFSFKLHEKTQVDLTIYDYLGRKLAFIIKEEKLDYGKYVYKLNIKENNMNSGLYYYVLKLNGVNYKKKSFIVK